MFPRVPGSSPAAQLFPTSSGKDKGCCAMDAGQAGQSRWKQRVRAFLLTLHFMHPRQSLMLQVHLSYCNQFRNNSSKDILKQQ